MPDAPQKRILVADADEVVAFNASHILTREGFTVDAVQCTCGVTERLTAGSYDAIVICELLAKELVASLDAERVIVLGDSVPGLKPFARLRKPIELDLLTTTVAACARQ